MKLQQHVYASSWVAVTLMLAGCGGVVEARSLAQPTQQFPKTWAEQDPSLPGAAATDVAPPAADEGGETAPEEAPRSAEDTAPVNAPLNPAAQSTDAPAVSQPPSPAAPRR